MLTQLTIANFGLIDHIEIDLHARLNILTGETGAGKSILMGALRSVLGERISNNQLRDETKPCVIEAVFELTDKNLRKLEIFEDYLDEDNTLIIQRTYSAEGRNKIKINGATVTVGQLKEIGNHLIDFHGPHDHQMLLSCESHIRMLDRLTDFGVDKQKYQDAFAEYSKLKASLAKLKNLSQSRERELDLVTHQVKELEQVPLDESAYEELHQEQIKINNAEKLHEAAFQIQQYFEEDGLGVSERIIKSFGPMKTLSHTDESTQSMADKLSQIQDLVDEYLAEVREYAEGLSFEPHQADEINDRFQMYEDIKRKYGPSLLDARAFYLEAKEKYDALINLEHNDADLRKKIDAKEKELTALAKALNQNRKKTAKSLIKTIEKELSELGISHVQFDVKISQTDFGSKGFDEVVFYISPNAGEELKPLSEIVSSGEAARVMLALKKALVDVDPIPVLIFDEIDAQIGGRLGSITGQKVKEISRIRQVLLITHLPQIASFADMHFKVNKIVQDGRAVTTVQALNDSERVDEIAQMMSGKAQSKISLSHAQDLLAKAQK